MHTADVTRLPPWVANKTGLLGPGNDLKRRLRRAKLVTVCEEARCPNLGECFSRGTATFMILGDTCTRRCGFCSVKTGRPSAPEADEANRIAEAAAVMGLRYVVLTTVARDDLEDQGAGQFARCISALRTRIPWVEVEVLSADLGGRCDLIGRVIEARPEVFGHNVETVRRLTPSVRGRAGYERSLQVLHTAGLLAANLDDGRTQVKTGLMVGLGETRAEISETLAEIHATGCSLLTVGQYLRPTREQMPVDRYVEPREFDEIAVEAREIGFKEVASGPLVRSSYRADRLFAAAAAAAPSAAAAATDNTGAAG